MDYRKIRSAEDLIKVGYGESLPLGARPNSDRSNASNIANMFSETMTVPLVNLKYKILGGDIEEIKSAFNELKTAWDSAMDSIHAISGNTYEYTADQAEYMLDNNDIMRIQDGEELIKASLRRAGTKGIKIEMLDKPTIVARDIDGSPVWADACFVDEYDQFLGYRECEAPADTGRGSTTIQASLRRKANPLRSRSVGKRTERYSG